ncbi:MAG TPA: DUF2332 family protein, partial [Actinomycetota bacterium]
MARGAGERVPGLDQRGVSSVADDRSKIAADLRHQAGECGRGGSPLYEGLLERAAEDVHQGGPVWSVLRSFVHDRTPVPGLRFMRAVHRIVLEGRAPELTAFYPSAGGSETRDPWPAFRETVAGHAAELVELTRPICQTNEVGRACAILPGFLLLARSGMPLRLLECGASAGL